MYTNSILALSGALLAVVAAVPMADPHRHHHQRDYVWVEHTEVVIETIPVTKTVWVEPGEYTPKPKPATYAPASSSPQPKPATTTPAAYTPVAPPAYTPPTSSSSSSSSTSVYVPPPAPTTPTSTYVAPTYAAPTTPVEPSAYSTTSSTSAPAPASTETETKSSGETGMAAAGKSYTGDLTWYDVGLGACGITSTPDESVIAIPEAIFDAYTTGGNPNNNPLCGKTITITGKDGSAFTGKIVDRCPGCSANDLDLSQTFFNTVTSNGDGRVGGMEWCFD